MIQNEYSSYGKGDFRHPAFQVQGMNGSRITTLKYQGFELEKGKIVLTLYLQHLMILVSVRKH